MDSDKNPIIANIVYQYLYASYPQRIMMLSKFNGYHDQDVFINWMIDC